MQYQEIKIEPSVFRAYDIRGIIGKHLDENAFYTIGRALSLSLKALNRDTIFLARDGRLTSDSLAKALQQGLLNSGINVVDIGAVATPVMYYATHAEKGIDSGLMITGSHNPADYNGIKMVLAGKTLAEADIRVLYNLVEQGEFEEGKGCLSHMDIMPEYSKRIVADIQVDRPLKVVVDCGNGIAGPVIPEVIKELGCEVIPLFCEVDGRFPNHHPDPTIEANLKDLKETVAKHQADIGLAFDGDADRLGVITNKGEVIWPDRLLMLYAGDVLSRNEKATIVYDVKCSSHLASVIRDAGGKAKMCPTGHSIVKAVMKEEKAALAGEMSGHIFFKERWYGFDDALYSACRLLEILSHNKASTSEQFAEIPNSVNTPEVKIPIDEAKKFDFMARFSANAQFPGAEIITIDGLRVEFPNGWGLLRASNTTPCLVARFEAKDEASLLEIQTLFKLQLMALDQEISLDF